MEKESGKVSDIRPTCQGCGVQITGIETCPECTECMLRKPVKAGVSSKVKCGCVSCLLTNECRDCHNEVVHGITPPLNGSDQMIVEVLSTLPPSLRACKLSCFTGGKRRTAGRALTGVGVGMHDDSDDSGAE